MHQSTILAVQNYEKIAKKRNIVVTFDAKDLIFIKKVFIY
jgi:hypothetical protein